MQDTRERFYKGDTCKKCGSPITIKNRSGFCNKCRNRSHPKKVREKIRQAKMAELNPMWKGDDVSYRALHSWVRSRKEMPELCENCKARKPYDLANKGIYDRNLENWWFLCRKCHMALDGRIKNLKQYKKE